MIELIERIGLEIANKNAAADLENCQGSMRTTLDQWIIGNPDGSTTGWMPKQRFKNYTAMAIIDLLRDEYESRGWKIVAKNHAEMTRLTISRCEPTPRSPTIFLLGRDAKALNEATRTWLREVSDDVEVRLMLSPQMFSIEEIRQEVERYRESKFRTIVPILLNANNEPTQSCAQLMSWFPEAEKRRLDDIADFGEAQTTPVPEVLKERMKNKSREERNNNEIRPGSVVQLRSGGPWMTVASIETDTGELIAKCLWFDGNMSISVPFPIHSLLQKDGDS